MFYYNMIENKNFTDINPLTCGSIQCEPNGKFGPYVRTFYLIHFIIKGKGRLLNPNGEYILEKNQAFLIKPNEVNVYIADEADPWEYIWIGFDGEVAKKLSELKNPIIQVDEKFIQDLLAVEKLNVMKEEYLAAQIFILFTKIFDRKTKNNYVEVVKNHMVSNYNMKITVEQLANIVNLDKRYLNKIFKNYVGQTIKQYLIHQRMKEAKRLLKRGYLVKTTATMVGYEDAFVFSRAYKNFYGSSPNSILKDK